MTRSMRVGFLKTVEGRNPFLSVDPPTKRRDLTHPPGKIFTMIKEI